MATSFPLNWEETWIFYFRGHFSCYTTWETICVFWVKVKSEAFHQNLCLTCLIEVCFYSSPSMTGQFSETKWQRYIGCLMAIAGTILPQTKSQSPFCCCGVIWYVKEVKDNPTVIILTKNFASVISHIQIKSCLHSCLSTIPCIIREPIHPAVTGLKEVLIPGMNVQGSRSRCRDLSVWGPMSIICRPQVVERGPWHARESRISDHSLINQPALSTQVLTPAKNTSEFTHHLDWWILGSLTLILSLALQVNLMPFAKRNNKKITGWGDL